MRAKIAILTPDGTYRPIVEQILIRGVKSLGLAQVATEFIKDIYRDSSGITVDLLRPYARTCSHALILRDLHGSGAEAGNAASLEGDLEKKAAMNGWDRAKIAAVVVDPEIEAWIRFDSVHFQNLIREHALQNKLETDLFFQTRLDEIIADNGGLNTSGKPVAPKEVFESCLRYFRIPRSNALYKWLAERESLRGCTVPSFNRLIERLKAWFPAKT